MTYQEQQKYSTPYNLPGITEIVYSAKPNQNSRNNLLRITYSEQQKYSTPYNLVRIARFYLVQLVIQSSTRYKNTTRVITFASLLLNIFFCVDVTIVYFFGVTFISHQTQRISSPQLSWFFLQVFHGIPTDFLPVGRTQRQNMSINCKESQKKSKELKSNEAFCRQRISEYR